MGGLHIGMLVVSKEKYNEFVNLSIVVIALVGPARAATGVRTSSVLRND